jgi:hypothetical protein
MLAIRLPVCPSIPSMVFRPSPPKTVAHDEGVVVVLDGLFGVTAAP